MTESRELTPQEEHALFHYERTQLDVRHAWLCLCEIYPIFANPNDERLFIRALNILKERMVISQLDCPNREELLKEIMDYKGIK